MPRIFTFRSSMFSIEPGEDEKTNPGVFGKSLASWMQRQLRDRGLGSDEPVVAEDFGWLTIVSRKPIFTWIACTSQNEPDQPLPSPMEWAVFVAADPSLMQRLTGKAAVAEAVQSLERQVEEILRSEPQITDLHADKG